MGRLTSNESIDNCPLRLNEFFDLSLDLDDSDLFYWLINIYGLNFRLDSLSLCGFELRKQMLSLSDNFLIILQILILIAQLLDHNIFIF